MADGRLRRPTVVVVSRTATRWWLATTVLAAVGWGLGSGSAAAQPLAAPAAARATAVTVTRADNGGDVTVTVGERVVVRLTGPTAVTWTEPASSDTALVRRRGSSGLTARAFFVATRRGSAQVTATGDDENCPACLGPIFGFDVTVSVVS